MTGCKFCQIVSGELPADIVCRDEISVVFLDHRPLKPGHCLVVPRSHYATLGEAPRELLGPLFGAAQLIARALEEGLQAEGSFLAINNRVSQSVPHLHIHVVPRRRKDGLRGFFWPRESYRDREEQLRYLRVLQEAVERLRAAAPSG
jgi:histidine triad (HIT) family protein